jgi:hypothetical protein
VKGGKDAQRVESSAFFLCGWFYSRGAVSEARKRSEKGSGERTKVMTANGGRSSRRIASEGAEEAIVAVGEGI